MKTLHLISLICLGLAQSLSAAEKPNFVLIFTDDQGYADLSCFGGRHVNTPRIDQMAAEGTKLTSFYVAAPLCTPSRAGLMTGCYPRRIDMAYGSDFAVLLAADKKGLNPEEVTIAEVLKSAGYKTGMFGKWHLGDQPDFLPTRQGFGEYFGIPYSHDIHPFHPRQKDFKFPPLPLLDNEKVIEMDPDADHLTRRITERAVKFIDAHKDEPFFLYVPHPIPHAPLHVSPSFMADVPDAIKAKLKAEKRVDYRTRRSLFRPAISEIDWSVGQILDALKKNGIDENTVVMFTSDNGPANGKATPLRGRKGSTFEGGMREPTVIRWPGKIPAGKVNDEIMTAMDLLPTFAKLAGAKIPADRTIDGKDIWPTLTGESGTPHEAFFYYRDNSLNAVRSGKWKLHLKDGEPAQLCDLESDIGEKQDLIKAQPEVVQRLVGYVKTFEKDIADNSRPAAFVEHPKPLSILAAAPGSSEATSKAPRDVSNAHNDGPAGPGAKPVSIESLLQEMVNRDSVARFPEQSFRLKQASSYDRSSKTPDDPDGWFSNFDRSTSDEHLNFVRTEENNGRKEWVVMEDEGAGAITRFWVPWRNQLKPGTDIVIRFYLDGASKPNIEGNMFELFQGKGLVPFPLAHESLRSAVSFFPIPYAKSCKVTMSDHPFFFQFTYREYNEDVGVKTFSMEDFRSAKSLIDATCQLLLNPDEPIQGDVVTLKQSIECGQGQSVSLPEGTAAVRLLSLKLGSYEDAHVTRHVVLKMSFDEKETVWCPIGDFFGSGIGLNPFQGWYRTVDSEGTMTSRWVMPYRNNAKLSIVNLGDEPVEVELSATVGDWKWDSSSMYFHAGWRGQYPVPTRPYSDWNYVTLKGRGVYVGDTLTIMNPVEKWWGEGDEKIFVDGETFPSIFGTGTEDYYAYSWGGRSTDFYEHPFHAQTFSHKYNKLNRKPKIDEKNTQGFSTETRTRALDTMPFATSLQLDMEVWSWTDCDMGYGVGVYWYGDADTRSNRKPEPKEVLNVPPVPKAEATSEKGKPVGTGSAFKNAVEINAKSVASKSEKIVLRPQNLKRLKLKGSWSLDDQLLFKGTQIGDVVELRILASGPVAETLTLHATKSRDYGILRFSVNGKPAGANVDFYSGEKASSYGPIVLGSFDPVDGAYVLRVEVVGKNPKSLGTFFGLDCVTLASPSARPDSPTSQRDARRKGR